jgi:alpha-D-xyloside xylohydrolase
LYEDENHNYNYEKGIYSTITFSWDDAKKTVTISDRSGSFTGMLAERKFNIVLVTDNRSGEGNLISKPDKVVSYTGKKLIIKF